MTKKIKKTDKRQNSTWSDRKTSTLKTLKKNQENQKKEKIYKEENLNKTKICKKKVNE